MNPLISREPNYHQTPNRFLSNLVLTHLLHNAQILLKASYRSLFQVPRHEEPGTAAWPGQGRGGGDTAVKDMGLPFLWAPGPGWRWCYLFKTLAIIFTYYKIKWLSKCTFWLTFMFAFHFIHFREKVDIHFFIQLIQQKFNVQLICLPFWMLWGEQRQKARHCFQGVYHTWRAFWLNGEKANAS